jgi:hypothetical protein
MAVTKRTYARIDGKDLYRHEDTSIAYRRLSEPTVWADEADNVTSGYSVALGVLALLATLGFIGWLLFAIM